MLTNLSEMKGLFRMLILAVLAVSLPVVAIFCQAPVDTLVVPAPFPVEPGGLNLEFLLQWTDALFGALLIGVSYLSAKIPGINKIPKTGWRVVAIALVLGMGFLMLGKSLPLNLVFSYVVATKAYELVLSLFVKTPKPGEVPAVVKK